MTTQRPLTTSNMRPTLARAGGGHERYALVDAAQHMIEEGSHSFATASKLFDIDTRERAWLLYAWCRRCDDIADNQDKGGPLGDQGTPKNAEDRIQAIRVLTRRAFEEQPTADPAFDGFGLVADECNLTPDLANDVIGGFALDAGGFAPKNERDMLRYCYHVAGAVGIMMARVMGVPEDDGETLDRVPAEWLADVGLVPGEHARPENRFILASVMPRMIALMEKHEEAAKLGTKRLRFRQRWAVLAAARIYGAIGRKVLARGQRAWDRRVRINRIEKTGHVIAALFAALRNNPPSPDEPILWSRHDFRPVAGW
ncbi:MAG: phytoene synthase [Citromicrobium sp.]|nr:MAG: phytoene synthase [Citromicrobium sp.]